MKFRAVSRLALTSSLDLYVVSHGYARFFPGKTYATMSPMRARPQMVVMSVIGRADLHVGLEWSKSRCWVSLSFQTLLHLRRRVSQVCASSARRDYGSC